MLTMLAVSLTCPKMWNVSRRAYDLELHTGGRRSPGKSAKEGSSKGREKGSSGNPVERELSTPCLLHGVSPPDPRRSNIIDEAKLVVSTPAPAEGTGEGRDQRTSEVGKNKRETPSQAVGCTEGKRGGAVGKIHELKKNSSGYR